MPVLLLEVQGSHPEKFAQCCPRALRNVAYPHSHILLASGRRLSGAHADVLGK